MRCESSVAELLESAAGGAESAWRELFRRYSPLVSSVCRRCEVFGADADDVSGNVWLRLVLSLVTIREPEALPGWLATTVQRECWSLLRTKRREVLEDREADAPAGPGADASLLGDERRDTVLREVARLPERERDLVSMLISDLSPSYSEISSSLGIPVGAIGPTRQRCLAKLRRTTAIAALLDDAVHDRSA
jgi:RNA polymerase sigma factor (sigma-70 family)